MPQQLFFADEYPNILPKFIPLYHYKEEVSGWKPYRFSQDSPAPAEQFHVFTWNLDSRQKHRKERMREALKHIREKHLNQYSESGVPPPCVMCLQEVHRVALETILRRKWIRKQFLVTPANPDSWADEKYGLVILVSKNIPVSRAFIIDLPNTEMNRQALFVDIHIKGPPASNDKPADDRIRTIRIANTHLEVGSGVTDLRARERQLRHIAASLNHSVLGASICAGSLGACLEEDTSIIAKAGFADAYAGRKWASETWGVQSSNDRYPRSRMDRILYLPTNGAKLSQPKRVGLCATIRDTEDLFVSDHMGLHSIVEILRDEVM